MRVLYVSGDAISSPARRKGRKKRAKGKTLSMGFPSGLPFHRRPKGACGPRFGNPRGAALSQSFASPAKSPEENYGFLWSAGERFPKERTVERFSPLVRLWVLSPHSESTPPEAITEHLKMLTTEKSKNPVRSFRIGFFPARSSQQIIHAHAIIICQRIQCIHWDIQPAQLIVRIRCLMDC